MSNIKLHIIQKQVIDIILPNATVALEWEATQRRDFATLINKQLERCFDDYDKNGNHLIIERLDIDLGIFTTNDLREEMPGRLYSKLYKILEHSKESITGIRTTESYYSETPNADRFYSGLQGELEALFVFLDKGHLPWWGSELANWDENWLRSLSENEIGRFRNFLSAGDEKPVKRLTTQFNDSFIDQLLHRFGVTEEAANTWHWLETVLKNLKDIVDSSGKSYSEGIFQAYQKFLLPAVVRTKYWVSWISHAVDKTETPVLHKLFNNSPEALEIISSVIKSKHSDDNPELHGKIPSLWEKEISAIIQRLQKKQNIEHPNEAAHKQTLSAEETEPEVEDKELLQIPGTETGTIEKSKDILSKLEDKKTKTGSEEEAIFVSNAGLIILHPFLPELFRHCGWLEKNTFINEYTQTTAIYALHYLATGETVIPEHQLMFPKFLAGMDQEALLEPVEPLNDKEQVACNQLLEEVLKHWKPSRNTSPQGLREAYLQRNGKLEHIYSGWHLTIEQKTLDILLSKLPWGISLIKFPWMPQMLTVTWQ
jgi:hypothetical protein